MSNAKFDLDLAHGELAEGMLRDVLTRQGAVHAVQVECKRDRKTWESGNVVVEYRCRGVPSGIAVSTAEWWAFILDGPDGRPYGVVMVPTEVLRSTARRLWRAGEYVRGGDDKAAEMVKVPVRLLVDNGGGM